METVAQRQCHFMIRMGSPGVSGRFRLEVHENAVGITGAFTATSPCSEPVGGDCSPFPFLLHWLTTRKHTAPTRPIKEECLNMPSFSFPLSDGQLPV
jgi:hypothetical protein